MNTPNIGIVNSSVNRLTSDGVVVIVLRQEIQGSKSDVHLSERWLTTRYSIA